MLAAWVQPFLEQLAIDGNVSRAARVAGISSTQVYALRKQDADFAEAWRVALDDAGDNLVAEARRRAVDGVNEPLTHQGTFTYLFERDADGNVVMQSYQVGEETHHRPKLKLDADGNPMVATVNKKSDTLLAMLVKGFKKQMFADRTELTGAEGGPVESQQIVICTGVPRDNDFSDLA